MNYETYEQQFNGTTRTIFRAYIGEGFIEAQSLERLKELINNHAQTKEGTFKNK
jgi:vacuolar-type H+-ATPase subunit I/STV1